MLISLFPFKRLVVAASAITLGSLPLQAGLVVHLRLDEGHGAVAKNSADLSAPGNFSTRGSEWTKDIPKTFVSRFAYRNSGVDGAYISVNADSDGIKMFDDFTMTGWVHAEEVNGQAGGFDRIISKRDEMGNRAVDIGFMNTGGGNEKGVGIGALVGSLNPVVSGRIDFSEGWVFFAITRRQATGEISIYLGTSDPAKPTQLERRGEAPPGTMENKAPLMIGNTPMGLHRAGVASYSDIRIYNEALEPEQIEETRLQNLVSPR